MKSTGGILVETEVLAPAGSIEGLKAALYAGADAESIQEGRMFGARGVCKQSI